MKNALEILDKGSRQKKILTLELLQDTSDVQIIRKIISMLDDEDIRVRGEAFSSLVANTNQIAEHLIWGLNSDNKTIRGHLSLVLSNRRVYEAVPELIKLTSDEHPMVRSCALGALGHLGDSEAGDAIYGCLTDSDMEVKKCAIQAAIDIGLPLSDKMLKTILLKKDPEVEKLIAQVIKER